MVVFYIFSSQLLPLLISYEVRTTNTLFDFELTYNRGYLLRIYSSPYRSRILYLECKSKAMTEFETDQIHQLPQKRYQHYDQHHQRHPFLRACFVVLREIKLDLQSLKRSHETQTAHKGFFMSIEMRFLFKLQSCSANESKPTVTSSVKNQLFMFYSTSIFKVFCSICSVFSKFFGNFFGINRISLITEVFKLTTK